MPTAMPNRLEGLPTLVEVATSILTLFGLLWAWFKRIGPAIRNNRRMRKARVEQDDAMRATWPTIHAAVTNYTGQFEALSEQIRIGFEASDKRLDTQDESIATILANTWAEMRMSPVARFECDSTGRNREVNPAYADQMRVDEKQLMGFGYKNYFKNPAFHALFSQAVKEHRLFDETTEACRGDGTCFFARVIARPFPDDPSKGMPLRWYGSVEVLMEIVK